MESVIRALGVDAYDLSRVAVEALGKIGDPRAVEPLIEMMRHREFSYRISAVQALIDIGGPAVEPLIKALESQDPDIRLNAVKALGEIKDLRAIKVLTERLKDENKSVREAAEAAVVKIQKANPKL